MDIKIINASKYDCHIQVGDKYLFLNNDDAYRLYSFLVDYLISIGQIITKSEIEKHGKQQRNG